MDGDSRLGPFVSVRSLPLTSGGYSGDGERADQKRCPLKLRNILKSFP